MAGEPVYGYDNPAPGTRLWRLRTHPETLTLEDAVQVATDLDAKVNETRQQGAQTARAEFGEAARLNHGERGHNFPWNECKREVCTWVRFLLDERPET